MSSAECSQDRVRGVEAARKHSIAAQDSCFLKPGILIIISHLIDLDLS